MPLIRKQEQPEAAQHPSTDRDAHVAARVEHIAQLKRSLRWVHGKSTKRLAAEWGLTEQYVRELSVEAAKIVRAELTDPDRVTGTVCGYVVWALRTAKKTGDVKAIAPLAKAWAELAGTLAPQRVEVTGGIVAAQADPDMQIALHEAALRALRSGRDEG